MCVCVCESVNPAIAPLRTQISSVQNGLRVNPNPNP